MASKTVQYFKDKFKSGYVITEQDYVDWLDSFRSSLVGVPLSDTTGLSTILAAYRKLSVKVPVADIDGLTTFVNNLTAKFLTTSSQIAQSQITGLVTALANCTTVAQVQQMITDGLQSVTPAIGGNGNWWVNGSDTGVKARGEDGDTPKINPNGNWEISGIDTGVRADFTRQIDYNSDISGARTGAPGSVLASSRPFVSDSLSVYLDGLRMSMGNADDFVINDSQSITINRAVTIDQDLIFDYLPLS